MTLHKGIRRHGCVYWWAEAFVCLVCAEPTMETVETQKMHLYDAVRRLWAWAYKKIIDTLTSVREGRDRTATDAEEVIRVWNE